MDYLTLEELDFLEKLRESLFDGSLDALEGTRANRDFHRKLFVYAGPLIAMARKSEERRVMLEKLAPLFRSCPECGFPDDKEDRCSNYCRLRSLSRDVCENDYSRPK